MLIQNNDEDVVDEEVLKKKTESKLKYRKLKQSLQSGLKSIRRMKTKKSQCICFVSFGERLAMVSVLLIALNYIRTDERPTMVKVM